MTPVEKKTFLKKAISDETTQRASLALGGINIAQNFVSETDNGRAAVAVLLAYSPKMEAVAASLARGEKPMIQAVGQPLDQLLPLNDPSKLADLYGPRIMIDNQGPVIVSFGLWSSSYKGGDEDQARRSP